MQFGHARLVVFALLVTSSVARAATPRVKFNRDIRPIMSDTCFRCHGPDSKSRMAGLRLDIRQDALKTTKSGVTPIVPGDPAKSAIIQRVFADNPAKIMPPKQAHKDLTAAQKDIIKRWVAEGAEYEGHWAYEPIRKTQPPAVSDPSLVRNPIDTFIQDRLAQENLKPSPEADRRTLLRRVTFDLTGVPPSQEEMKAFLDDKSADAYEKVVDRLLASQRYAEMQTMRWLDAVRYSDTAGFHGDNPWPAWPYRDYVLQSFLKNKPFDQFTREQIAGDLIPNATREQKVASAFNRLNRASAEGGIQPKEYLAKYGADRVRTVSTVWLGATVGCAECHDHKFDPYLAKDFYSMKAFFSDIKETGLIPDRGAKAWGVKLSLPTPEQEQRLAKFEAEILSLQKNLLATAKDIRERRWEWEEKTLAAHKAGKLAWKYQQPLSASSSPNGAKLTIKRVSARISHESRNSEASESSSSGCVGHSPCEPRSSSTFDNPVPKYCRQVRLTNTRGVSGLSFDTSQFARSRRVALPSGASAFPKTTGIAGVTISPASSRKLPRRSILVSLGRVRSVVITLGIEACSSVRSASSFANRTIRSCKSGCDQRKCLVTNSCCSSVRSASSVSIAFRTSGGIPRSVATASRLTSESLGATRRF